MLDKNKSTPGIFIARLPSGRWYWEAWYYTRYGAMFNTCGETGFMFGAIIATLWAHYTKKGYDA